MLMQTTLNEAEQKLAIYLAKRRYQFARKNGLPDEKQGNQSNEQTDLEGIASEIAFCKMMNVYPDTQIGIRNYADAFTLEYGAVDVKSTKWKNGRLLARLSKADKKTPDSYALMIGEFPTYELVGWKSAEELLRKENIGDLGHGEGFMLEQNFLNEPYRKR